ncbi:MAG: hypothetical protein ACJ704_01070 [Nitrososphaeraceae archaeon]
MYLVNVITSPLYEYEYQFAICESCFWCATVFHKAAIKEEQEEDIIESSNNNNLQQQICPTCKNKSISLIPLAKDEIYTIAMEGKRGVEMEFSKLGR